MRQPDIGPDDSQERLEEALLLDAAANVRYAREVAVVSYRVFGVDAPTAWTRNRNEGSTTRPPTVDPRIQRPDDSHKG